MPGRVECDVTKLKTDATTSRRMRAVRQRGTAPELAVRSELHKLGYRFTLRRTDLPGRPDIVLPKHRAVIFAHGCFWHGHSECKHGTTSAKRNASFWTSKIAENTARDKRVEDELEDLGWRVVTVWECECSDRALLREMILARLEGTHE